MHSPVRSLVLSVLILASACARPAPAPDTAADVQAIKDLVTAWNGYLVARNDSAIAALYAPDGVLLPPNLPRVTGTESNRAFWAQIWPLNATLTLASVSVTVSGDLAVEEGNWTWSAPTPQGDQKDNGKYLVIWRRQDGTWKVIQDIWNSDTPPPPPAPAPATR